MADDDWKSKLASGLVENVPVLLIGLGAILIILGLTTGIHGWIAIDLPWARWVAVLLGVVLVLAGIIASPYSKGLPGPDSLKLTINYPPQNAELHHAVMGGNIAKPKLPRDYDLCIIKHYPKGWAPIGVARLNKDTKTWESSRCSIGGSYRESIRISVCLVGPSGKVLVDYFNEAASVHEAAMRNLPGHLPPGIARNLPPIESLPPDIVECASIQYTRDNTP